MTSEAEDRLRAMLELRARTLAAIGEAITLLHGHDVTRAVAHRAIELAPAGGTDVAGWLEHMATALEELTGDIWLFEAVQAGYDAPESEWDRFIDDTVR